MRRIIPHVPFCDNDFYPCGPVALDAMLQFYGYTTPQVLHSQWLFVYHPLPDVSLDVTSRFTSLYHDMQKCGVFVTEHQESGAEAAWQHTRLQLDMGRPVPALADTHYLEKFYYPGLGHHSDHYVILAGYHDATDTVHVVDPSPSKRFRGDLPLMGFFDAWGSDHIQAYTWMQFEVTEPNWTLTPEEVVRSIGQNLRLMHYNRPTPVGPFIGLQGIRKLADDVTQWKNLGVDQARNCLKQLFSQLRYVLMERDGHGKYLKLAAVVLSEPTLGQVGDQLWSITQKWMVFRNLCLKGHRRNRPEVFEKLRARLLEIASLEKTALAKLREII